MGGGRGDGSDESLDGRRDGDGSDGSREGKWFISEEGEMV